MAAEIISLDRGSIVAASSRAAAVLNSGGVIAYPTETFYGLGVNPRDLRAVQRLFSIKGRQADQPILLLIKDAGVAAEWAAAISPQAQGYMDRFWPGPLTLLFPARADVLPALTAGTGKIGLRVPGNQLTRDLLESIGGSLTGTSANQTGRPGLSSAADVARELGEAIDLILDGGTTPGGLPSTVLDTTVDPPRVVREGVVKV